MAQVLFSGTDFGFRWTSDDWYEYDGSSADKKALQARNKMVKELKSKCITARKFSLGDQLVSFGGIGSGKPHIELVTKCYGLNY